MRQIVLDTETTGLETAQHHRIIEVGCVELIDRRLTGRHFHYYINPEREIDAQAQAVHGITPEFLADKPLFADIAEAFIEYVRGAELVIHNASFDIRFLDYELALLGPELGEMTDYCTVLDTLALAKKRHPGGRNNLDALCKRYGVDNSRRDLHGALLDAEILADVYLLMTGGQVGLSLEQEEDVAGGKTETRIRRLTADRKPVSVRQATADELEAHRSYLAGLAKEGKCLWSALENPETTKVELESTK